MANGGGAAPAAEAPYQAPLSTVRPTFADYDPTNMQIPMARTRTTVISLPCLSTSRSVPVQAERWTRVQAL